MKTINPEVRRMASYKYDATKGERPLAYRAANLSFGQGCLSPPPSPDVRAVHDRIVYAARDRNH